MSRRETSFSGAIRSVALGSEGGVTVKALASENGRNGAESSWSSSASERGPSGGLELERRERRI